MATPPPAKRRRLSLDPNESPQRGISAPPRRSQSRTPSRPSFASPTKASLARHNPGLLAESPRRRSRPARTSIDDFQNDRNSRDIRPSGPALPTIDLADIDPALLDNPAASRVELQKQISEQVMRSLGQAMSDVVNSHVGSAAPAGLAPMQDRLDEVRAGKHVATTSARRDDQSSRRGLLSPATGEQAPPLDDEPDARAGASDDDASSNGQHEGGPVQAAKMIGRDVPSNSRLPATEAIDIRGYDKDATDYVPKVHDAAILQERANLINELSLLRKQVNSLTNASREVDGANSFEESQTSLLRLLSAIEADETSSQRDQQLPTLNTLLGSFMPFSTPIIVPIDEPKDGDEQEHVPSCKPIDLPDPLPHLQLFSSLQLTHRAHLPTQEQSRGSLKIFQCHEVTLSTPQKILCCDFAFTVSHSINQPLSTPQTSTIEDTQINSISMWARKELGPWLDRRAKQSDIPAIGFGLNRYWDVANRRKQCWRQCIETFHAVLKSTPLLPVSSSMDDISLLHRDRLVFETSEACLSVYWQISLHELTGEAESRVFLRARFSDVWYEADRERSSLAKLPGVFDRLVRERGVFGAIEVVVSLIG